MRAMVLEQSAPIETSPLLARDVNPPVPGPREVRVRVTACALCRTDLHVIEADLPPIRRPLIPGHQIVGTVDQLGPGCSRLRIGQRIGIAWLASTDNTCAYCRRGRENLCPNSRYTGYHRDGGYAQFATVLEDYAYDLPADLGSDARVSPLLCAGIIGYRAYKRTALPPDGTLLMVGFGSSAHIVLPIALHNAQRVLVVTRSPGHQQLARDMGASWAGDEFSDLPQKPDAAILFAPSGKLVPPIMESFAPGGVLALAGIVMSDVPSLEYQRHLFHDKEIRSVESNTRDDGREFLAQAAAARVKPRIKAYRLEDANRALLEMKQSRIDGTGVLLVP
jgi:alcohol dehydrogenase, propanol-preferring